MRAAFAAVFLLSAHVAAAAPARWHFSFGKWRLSIFFEREQGRGDTTRLLLDAGAGRFVFVSSQDPSGRDSTESIRRLPDGETLTRRLVLSSFEEIPACSSVRAPDACVNFTGSGGTFATALSSFAGERAAPAREKAAALVSRGMRDALFALAPLLPAVAEFGSYSKDFLGLVWPERFTAPQKLVRGERKPGCAFDATFGFPCSEDEKSREAKRFSGPTR
ncbi:MAG TPA: hypothetical protein VGM13_17605 [Thermoanaerobaculia bacterium]